MKSIYEQYKGIFISLLIAFIICLLIDCCFSSCSRKTVNIEEETAQMHHVDVSDISTISAQSATDTQSWWEATTITLSKPDTVTGQQYVTSRTVASGGTIKHDTIYIQSYDSVRTEARDSILSYRYLKEEAKSGSCNIFTQLAFMIIVLIILYIIYMVYRKYVR